MEALFGGLQRAIEVGALGMGDFAGGLAGGGVEHDQLAAGGGVGPGAIDVELNVRIHGRLLANRHGAMVLSDTSTVAHSGALAKPWPLAVDPG